MLDAGVAEYIRRKGLWSPAARKAALTAQIAAEPENTELYAERGKLHYRLNEWGAALNDFNRVLRWTPATPKRGSMRRWCRKYWNSDTKTYTTPDNDTFEDCPHGRAAIRPNGKSRFRAPRRSNRRWDHEKYDITVIDLHHRDCTTRPPTAANGRWTRTTSR